MEIRYSYEILGGILIFLSSLVSEQMSPAWRKRAWIIFGSLAIAYSGFGVYLDHDAFTKERTDRKNHEAEMKGLRGDLSNLLTAVGSAAPMISVMSADIAGLKGDIEKAKKNHDPETIARLQSEVEAKQKQAESASKQLLLAMIPGISGQLYVLASNWYTEDDEILNRYSIESRVATNSTDMAHLSAVATKKRDNVTQKYLGLIRPLMTTADYLRQRLLQEVSPLDQTAEDKQEAAVFAKVVAGETVTPPEVLVASKYLMKLPSRISAPQHP